MANTFNAIRTLTVTGSPADIQFTNIPQTYTDLCLAVTAAGRLTSGAAGALVIYTAEGQSSGLSDWRDFRGVGNTVSTAASAYPIVGILEYLSSGAYFSSVFIYIGGYTTNAQRQMFLSDSATGINSSAASISMNSLIINSTSPITFLGLGDGSAGGGLKVGSTATLYGISKT